MVSYTRISRYPMRRRTTRRRTTTRRRAGMTRKRFVRTLHSVAERKRVLHTERGAEVDWTGRRMNLSLIAQGAGEDERIGRIVTPYAVTCKAVLRNTDTDSTIRVGYQVLLVQDLQTVGDTPASIGEIVSDIGTFYAHIGLLNVNNKGRFKILKRWSGMLMPISSAASGAPSMRMLDFYYRFPPRATKNLRFNGPASTDIEANHLSLVFITNADPVENAILLDANVRMWYTDV